MRLSFVTTILERIAPAFGARVEVEPAWGYAGRVVFPNGRAMRFVGTHLDVNPLGAAAIATDKAYTKYFLGTQGLPVPEGEAFFSRAWAREIGSDRTPDAALTYAEHLGFPVFVKPNSLRAGIGVHCVGSSTVFADAVRRITRRDRVVLVERPIAGHDLRIVVVDGAVVCAYERTPLTVVGDGRTTIADLFRVRLAALQANNRGVQLRGSDSRIAARLARIGVLPADVPAMGEHIQLLDNANLSSGGTARDITDALDPTLVALAVRAAHAIGLSFAGVDVIARSVSLREPRTGEKQTALLFDIRGGRSDVETLRPRSPSDVAIPSNDDRDCHVVRGLTPRNDTAATILECNAAPSLAHYAASGAVQRARAEECYRRVLALFARQGASDSASVLTRGNRMATVEM